MGKLAQPPLSGSLLLWLFGFRIHPSTLVCHPLFVVYLYSSIMVRSFGTFFHIHDPGSWIRIHSRILDWFSCMAHFFWGISIQIACILTLISCLRTHFSVQFLDPNLNFESFTNDFALFFPSLLDLSNQSFVSTIWPPTSVSYLFPTLAQGTCPFSQAVSFCT